jgi:hypothetical protein
MYAFSPIRITFKPLQKINPVIVRILSFFSLLLLVSCDDDNPYPTEEQWKTGMDTVRFDEAVFSNFKKYEELRDFLEANADTILSSGKKSEYSVNSHPFSDYDKTDPYVPYQIPENKQTEFSSILKKLPHLESFMFDKDTNVYFKVKDDLGLINFDHYLYWNPIAEGDNMDDRFKDARLDSTCKYRIVGWWYEGR